MTDERCKAVSVVGAGGHAKVVISTLRAAGFAVSAIYDDATKRQGTTHFGVPIVGPVDALPDVAETLAVIAIGDCRVRERLASRFKTVTWITAVHPRAYVDPTVQVGPGSVVFAGAVIQPDAVLGSHVIVNTGATIDHDCRIEDFAHLAPGVHLAGGVCIGEGAFLGVGANVIPGCKIGCNTVVGAGGVVIADLPDGVTAVGVPTRIIGRRQ